MGMRWNGYIKGNERGRNRKAWIGLPNWEQGFMQPNFVTKAKKWYLVGPYDSYHSIHEKVIKLEHSILLMTRHYTKRLL